jgi:hypothetical protein
MRKKKQHTLTYPERYPPAWATRDETWGYLKTRDKLFRSCPDMYQRRTPKQAAFLRTLYAVEDLWESGIVRSFTAAGVYEQLVRFARAEYWYDRY